MTIFAVYVRYATSKLVLKVALVDEIKPHKSRVSLKAL
jgi:hypothetical protein